MRLKRPRISLASGRSIIAALLVGAILHICATLVQAHLLGGPSPFDRLDPKVPINQMVTLPPATAQTQVLPFQLPDTAYALCRYDTRSGAVAVRASLLGESSAFAVHTSDGGTAYSVVGQQGRRIEVAILIVPAGEEFVQMPRSAPGAEGLLTVPVPSRRGIVVVQSTAAGTAYRSAATAQVASATCSPAVR